MTPQKVFMDSIHLWIIPLVLVGLKVLYDILPKVAFFGIVAAIAIGYFANEKLATKRIERAAKELEESADSFLDEIDSADKVKKEKDAKKKASKELQRQEKLRAQEKQKRREESEKPKAKSAKSADDSDEDSDEMLLRLAAVQKKKSK